MRELFKRWQNAAQDDVKIGVPRVPVFQDQENIAFAMPCPEHIATDARNTFKKRCSTIFSECVPDNILINNDIPSLEHVEHVEHVKNTTPQYALITGLEASFPDEWGDGYLRLCRMRHPRAYSAAEWQELKADAGYFLDAWASQCSTLGWTLADAFGVAVSAPQARYDGMGLVPLLHGKKIIAVTAELAVIETAMGGRQRYFRRKHKPSCSIVPIWGLK